LLLFLVVVVVVVTAKVAAARLVDIFLVFLASRRAVALMPYLA
jgi:hypothetical protein